MKIEQQFLGTDKFDELLRRVELTCKARYHASKRLGMHDLFSQWTLALLVVGHIVIALVLALELHTAMPGRVVHFSAVMFGVMVLAYSLLLGLGRYGARSIQIHSCGLELGRLARKLYGIRGTTAATQDEYERLAKDYYDCLEKYENHARADYHVAHYDYYSGLKLIKGDSDSLPDYLWQLWNQKRELMIVKVKDYALHALQFSHYVISLTLVWAWVLYLLWPSLRQGFTGH